MPEETSRLPPWVQLHHQARALGYQPELLIGGAALQLLCQLDGAVAETRLQISSHEVQEGVIALLRSRCDCLQNPMGSLDCGLMLAPSEVHSRRDEAKYVRAGLAGCDRSLRRRRMCWPLPMISGIALAIVRCDGGRVAGLPVVVRGDAPVGRRGRVRRAPVELRDCLGADR